MNDLVIGVVSQAGRQPAGLGPRVRVLGGLPNRLTGERRDGTFQQSTPPSPLAVATHANYRAWFLLSRNK